LSEHADTELTTKEAMAYLNVSRRTLERYVEQKKLRKYRVDYGRERVRFRKSELDKLKESRPVDQSGSNAL